MRLTNGRLETLAMTLLACASLTTQASSQVLPDVVKIINTTAPGGGSDTGIRILMQWIGENGGPTMITESRPGGAGAIALNSVKNATPDGGTLVVCESSAMASNVWLFKKMSYDPQSDFAPVATFMTVPVVLVVPASSPAKSISEFISYGKSKADGLTYGSQAVGASGHLMGAYLGKVAEIKTVHIPFRGSGPAMAELVAGRLDFFWTSYPSVKAFHEGGQVRILAISSKSRDPGIPDIPTVKEAGYPQFEIGFWFGLCAPAKTPASTVNALYEKIAAAVRAPSVIARYRQFGIEPQIDNPEEFKKLIISDTARLKPIVEATGAQLD